MKRISTEDYRGEHEAPDRESGAPLHDLCSNGVYPKDVYDMGAKWYGTGEDAMDNQAFHLIRYFRDKPEGRVWIYRAVPKQVPLGASIEPGDWVSIVKDYAKDHGESALNGNYRILSKRVWAKDVYTDGDSPLEWGWDPA